MKREFALYRGEELLSIGTIEEIAEEVGVLKETVKFYGTPTYARRIQKRKRSKCVRILIEIEEGD